MRKRMNAAHVTVHKDARGIWNGKLHMNGETVISHNRDQNPRKIVEPLIRLARGVTPEIGIIFISAWTQGNPKKRIYIW